MKTKLIKLSDTHYIVVDDSEIKEDCYCFDEIDRQIWFGKFTMKKITHSTQPLEYVRLIDDGVEGWVFDKIKPIFLSEVEQAIYGYSIEKMAWNLFGGSYERRNVESEEEADKVVSFGIECIKAHQELVENKHKEVIELLKNITEWSSYKDHPIGKQAQRALDIMYPKTEWDIEIINGKIKLI